MQVNPTDAAVPAAALPGNGVVARVEAGSLAGLPLDSLLGAVVTQSGPRETVLDLGGRQLTLRTPPGFPTNLPAGTALAVRIPPTTTPTTTLEIVGRVAQDAAETASRPAANAPAVPVPETGTRLPPEAANRPAPNASASAASPEAGRGNIPVATARPELAQTAAPAGQPLASAQQGRLAAVDVLAVLPDGRVRVRIDGAEEPATSPAALAPGSRYVVAVERTPTGLVLHPPPDSPKLASEVAAAVLRAERSPDLAAALKPLLAELAAFRSSPANNAAPLPPAVQKAADAVLNAIRGFLPAESRPPNASELRQLVENGGLHFEAKLARLASEPDAAPAGNTAKPTPQQAADSPNAATTGRAPAHELPQLKGDLKGDLLRLLQVAQDLGTATTNPATPAARAAVNGIEAQQAANAAAQAQGTAYFLQVPFPDAGEWRTLHLALEREPRHARPDAQDGGSFRMLMHVPLTALGETWIDAGLTGQRFRAVLYLDRPEARDRVRAELPGLQTELAGEGFEEVLLDVRPAADLPASRRRQGAEMRAGRPESVSVLDVRA